MKGELPPVTHGRILGLSAGYLGLQITFGIESASLSRVYQGFGAGIEDLALLWLAGPLAGLLVQPVIGHVSDQTWTRFGRRRPWMLGSGAIATASLVGLAFAPGLAWAITMIWLLEISMNALNAPYRALVGDTLPKHQHGKGFAMQTVFIGVGAFVGALVPKALSLAGMPNVVAEGSTPLSVRLAFLAAATCLSISVIGTVMKVREYTKDDYVRLGIRLEDRRAAADAGGRPSAQWQIVLFAYRRIAAMQFFAWAALYLLWVYATPVVAQGAFAAMSVEDPRYGDGADWVGVMFATYNGVAGLFAFILPRLFERFGASRVHAVAMSVGAAGFTGVALAATPMLLLACAALIGIAYASMLSAPFVMASRIARQGQAGSAIGLMNVFIVVPQLVMGLGMGALVRRLLAGEPAGTLLIAGTFSLLAAAIAASGKRHFAN